MFVFLDKWSIIPCIILLLSNLMVFGISFKRFTSPPGSECDEEDINSIALNRVSTMDYANKPLEFGSSHSDLPRTPTEEEKMKTVVGWVPPNNLPPSAARAHHLKPYKYDQIGWNTSLGILSPPTPSPNLETSSVVVPRVSTQPEVDTPDTRVGMMERMQSLISSSDKTDTPSYINEDNTSIFLNSITAMFFPSCHTHIEAIGSNLSSSDPEAFFIRNKERHEKLIEWQCHVYQRQVYIYNSLLMLMIGIIIILVSGVQSFNYFSNVMDSFWFIVVSVMILISGLISICITWSLNRNITKQCFHTDNTSERLSFNKICVSFIKCIIGIIIVLVPILLSLIVFVSIVKMDPYVFLISQSRTGPHVNLNIIKAFPVKSTQSNKVDFTVGKINLNYCDIIDNSNFKDQILVINATKAKCKSLLDDEEFYVKAAKTGAAGIILLDNTPESSWRVSSPMSESINSLVGSIMGAGDDIPFLMLRQLDWVKVDEQILEMSEDNRNLFIVWSDPESLDLNQIFSCSDNSSVTIESSSDENDQHCSDGKHLYDDGRLSERICVSGECSVLGHQCPGSVFDKFSSLSLNLECDSLTDVNLHISSNNSPDLRPVKLSNRVNGEQWSKEYCCYNDHLRDFNSTLEVLGDECFNNWREVSRHLSTCAWTTWIQGECVRGYKHIYRLCLVKDGCETVIRESYDRFCNTETILQNCRNDPFQCV